MSVFDKMIAAVTPPESDEARAEARSCAMAAAKPGDWFSMILDHHRQLEAAFAKTRGGRDAAARKAACKELGGLITAHAIAEEAVIYPALAACHQKAHAGMGYNEQAMVKMEMAELEKLDPMSQDWIDKLDHIQGAVAHHMYQEEGTWFLDLSRDGASESAMLTQRYSEEFERYMGGGKQSGQAAGERSAMFANEPVMSAGMAR